MALPNGLMVFKKGDGFASFRCFLVVADELHFARPVSGACYEAVSAGVAGQRLIHSRLNDLAGVVWRV